VADIYRRLGWTRQQVEQVVRMERDTLARWGMRLHTATASEGFGRKERYITVDGTRYSALSLDTHGRAWPDGMDGMDG